MSETTFDGLTVTIPATSPHEAYRLLCEALQSIGAEWEIDSYSTDGAYPKPTTDLWPNDEEGS